MHRRKLKRAAKKRLQQYGHLIILAGDRWQKSKGVAHDVWRYTCDSSINVTQYIIQHWL